MKSPKKLLLKIEPDYDFKLVGIVCALPGYRIGWLFNQTLTFVLERDEDIEVHLPRHAEPVFFEFYRYVEEELRLEYYLLANKNNGALLVPEMRQVDYWMLIKGVFENLNEEILLKQIKKISSVQTAFFADINSLKSKENLIF